MAALPRSLAETSITINDFARYVNRSVITVRHWFESDPEVTRTPRGNQRAQILIPISHALFKCRQMGIPEALIQTIVSDHKERAERAAQSAPAPAPAPVPKRARTTKARRAPKGAKARAGSLR